MSNQKYKAYAAMFEEGGEYEFNERMQQSWLEATLEERQQQCNEFYAIEEEMTHLTRTEKLCYARQMLVEMLQSTEGQKYIDQFDRDTAGAYKPN